MSENPLLDLSRSLDEIEAEKKPFSIEDLPPVWGLDVKVDWLIDGLVPFGAITLLTGESGVGKSTLALLMAGATVHGTSFLGRKAARTPALYVDGENPVSTVRERLERLQIAANPDLHIWGGWNDPGPIGPKAESIVLWARKREALIIFDSLIQFHPGSEQDSSETRKYFSNYRHLANQGAAVVVLHHTGKGENSKQYRGSSDIKASVDQAYCLEAVCEAEGGSQALSLVPFKCRMAEVHPIRLDFRGGTFHLAKGASRTNQEIIEQIVGSNPDRTGREVISLASSAGVAKNRSEAVLMEGAKDGWLVVTRGPKNSKLYRLRGPDD